jgi:hypothetical protein
VNPQPKRKNQKQKPKAKTKSKNQIWAYSKFWEVFLESPGVFGKSRRFRKLPGVLEKVAEFWDQKNTFCDHSFAKIQIKSKNS